MKYYEKEMDTIHPNGCVAMTWEDAEAMEKLNNENGWGFGMSDLLRLVADHMDAREFDDHEHDRIMEMIEWRLTDANFHTFCELLHDNKYDNAVEWIMKEVV